MFKVATGMTQIKYSSLLAAGTGNWQLELATGLSLSDDRNSLS